MRIILFLLFSISILAQEGITIGKGGAKYNWTADSVSAEIVDNNLLITGYSHFQRNATGNNTFSPYIRTWVGVFGAKDSVKTNSLVYNYKTLDTDTLFYDYSTIQNNGRWTNSADKTYTISAFYYLVSTEGDTLLSNEGSYLITTE